MQLTIAGSKLYTRLLKQLTATDQQVKSRREENAQTLTQSEWQGSMLN